MRVHPGSNRVENLFKEPTDESRLRVAIVHDWLVVVGGAERVLEQILSVYPEADLYAVCDFLRESDRQIISHKTVTTSFIQKLPMARSKYRGYLPLMPYAVERFDLSGYDLIISSSHAVAKGVITGPDQIHICYCHSPMRYVWDLSHQYLKEAGLTSGLKGTLATWMLHRMRNWDALSANRVDYFVANSEYISRRIKKAYRRDSTVIHPPVDMSAFELRREKDDYYVTASRMVPYKKVDLIVEAFSKIPERRLVVIGDGPEFKKVKAKAGQNVTLLGYQPFQVLRDYMQKANAFVFAAEEDFGIVPVEAQACGTPVIAYGKGGATETVADGRTGVLFHEQTTESIIEAVEKFESHRGEFDAESIRRNSLRFSAERFRDEFKAFVGGVLAGQQRGKAQRQTIVEHGVMV